MTTHHCAPAELSLVEMLLLGNDSSVTTSPVVDGVARIRSLAEGADEITGAWQQRFEAWAAANPASRAALMPESPGRPEAARRQDARETR